MLAPIAKLGTRSGYAQGFVCPRCPERRAAARWSSELGWPPGRVAGGRLLVQEIAGWARGAPRVSGGEFLPGAGSPEVATRESGHREGTAGRCVWQYDVMDLKIAGKTALVTGGTKGIGRAIVNTFVAEGANVAFCARSAEEVTAVEAIFADSPSTVIGSVLNVRDAVALTAWVDASAQKFGGIDMIVANVSALAIPDTAENWVDSFEVDVMGTVNLVKAALPYLETSDAPSIVAISSVSGREADFASGPYGTAKTAIIGYIGGLALQLAPTGIRANTVSPGNTYEPGGVWSGIETGNPDLYSLALGLNPTGRMGTAQEIASGVVFLSSPVSSRTTGTNLLIDGALTRGIQF